MGTSRSAAELNKKMQDIATTIPRATRAGVTQASQAAKETIIAVAASRGVSRSSRIAGGKWSVGYNVKGTTNPTSLIRIRGPFHLVESNTRAHEIKARRAPGSRSRRRGKRALAFDGVVRTRVQHPGTRGKHIFRDAKQRIMKQTPPAVFKHILADVSQRLR
jgi:hypothetical protein